MKVEWKSSHTQREWWEWHLHFGRVAKNSGCLDVGMDRQHAEALKVMLEQHMGQVKNNDCEFRVVE